MKYFLFLAFLLLTESVAVEQTQSSVSDGNDLLPRCQAAINSLDRPNWRDAHESYNAGFCTGLVEGVSTASPVICPPKGVPVSQGIRVVVKYLEDNPDKLNLREVVLIEAALEKAFFCKQK